MTNFIEQYRLRRAQRLQADKELLLQEYYSLDPSKRGQHLIQKLNQVLFEEAEGVFRETGIIDVMEQLQYELEERQHVVIADKKFGWTREHRAVYGRGLSTEYCHYDFQWSFFGEPWGPRSPDSLKTHYKVVIRYFIDGTLMIISSTGDELLHESKANAFQTTTEIRAVSLPETVWRTNPDLLAEKIENAIHNPITETHLDTISNYSEHHSSSP